MTSEYAIDYPEALPVSAHRAEILKAVRENPVVIVCGDTGSGKTTQLPKMMLELGRAAKGRRIAVTQPRRLAAVTMAERVAEELRAPEVGGLVGYRHRYDRRVSGETRIEFMTDGVLLAETKSDPLLRAYDTIIVDEAHERSLNVDFLLGILRLVLNRRRDLKVIIASATMDTMKFSKFFFAPVIDVPGRLFPIDVRYRPPEEDDDLPSAVARALDELPAEFDVLVFLSGERDIREVGEYLTGARGGRDDVIPLLASLPAGEQRRAFLPSSRRRIVLATNVAETSVTIPGIRAVVDSGVARISRYLHRTQVQRLQVEPVSQASARQRAGRCGRLGPGVCIRLYSEEDFLRRDEYTPPEILRSSLAGVILTMLDLKLGNVEEFPFVDPPSPAMVREGLRELLELGAIRRPSDAGERRGIELTDVGRKLARIPVEPRLARMLIAAAENAVLGSALPIVAAMACDDPKRRPLDEKERAAQAHAKWRVAESDFLGTLKLWDWWRDEAGKLSQSKARKLAKANYLSWPKMREWCDLTRQLESMCRRLGLSFAAIEPSKKPPRSGALADTYYAALHMSLLSGLLGRLGHYHSEDREYRGVHGLRFALHPGSALAKRDRNTTRRDSSFKVQRSSFPTSPEWIVAGELVDTARLFAREAAVIDAGWIEPIAGKVCKHHVHSPAWDPKSGFVRATEQVTLYGLVVVEARRCDYARFEPAEARRIFLRDGLIAGELPHPPPALRETLALMDRLRTLSEKSRDASLFDEERLFAHFDAAVPAEIANANALGKWLARASKSELAAFRLDPKEWSPKETAADRDFPESIEVDGVKLRLSYRNDPDDSATDGVTCTVKKSEANALHGWRSDWLVPGMLRMKVSYLLRCLPNSKQRLLNPLDDCLAILMDMLDPAADVPLERAIRLAVRERWGFHLPKETWENVKLPPYLQVRFVVRDDESGRVIHDSREKPAREAPKPVPLPLTKDVPLEPAIKKLVKEILEEERRIDFVMGLGGYPESTVDAVLKQLAWMTFEGFPQVVPRETLLRYPKYLKAISVRLERAKNSPSSDRAKEARFAPYWERYREALAHRETTDPVAMRRYRWLLEEYRLQIFAPELRTHETVSPKILDSVILEPED